jgi:hypothetical protein
MWVYPSNHVQGVVMKGALRIAVIAVVAVAIAKRLPFTNQFV